MAAKRDKTNWEKSEVFNMRVSPEFKAKLSSIAHHTGRKLTQVVVDLVEKEAEKFPLNQQLKIDL